MMANDSKVSLEGKRPPLILGVASCDTSGLRRSTRASTAKKNMIPSPSLSSTGQSQQQLAFASPPAKRKSERLEQKNAPSPLRRSLRGKIQDSSSSSGSKKSDKSSGSLTVKKKQKKEKSVEQLTLEAKEMIKSEEKVLEPSKVKKTKWSASAYRKLFNPQSRKYDVADHSKEQKQRDNIIVGHVSDLGDQSPERNVDGVNECNPRHVEDMREEDIEFGSEHEANSCQKKRMDSHGVSMVLHEDIIETKRQRVSCDAQHTGFSSYNAKEDSCGSCIAKGRGESKACVTSRFAEHNFPVLQRTKSLVDFQLDGDQNTCLVCKLGGKLLHCDGLGCKRSCHLLCLEPPLKDFPLGVWWYCFNCVRKKIASGVHSISEGVESVWDAREVELSDNCGLQKQKEYFVKYKGLAHVHNRWVPENQLLLEAPSLVAEFNQKNQLVRWKHQWTLPQRLLQKQAIMASKLQENCNQGYAGGPLDSHYEWLVKWHGLGYEHATWELDSAPFMNSPEAQKLLIDYENRHDKAKRAVCQSRTDKKLLMKKDSSNKLSQFSVGSVSGFNHSHLNSMDSLCEFWQKGQNAVLVDDQAQIPRAISFITSLLSSVFQPFLIVTTSAMLDLWNEEFLRLAPSIDIVVYNGNEDVRKSIRTLEFCEEGGYALFQILITSIDIIIEDIHFFEAIKWEAIIVDECQHSSVYSHFEEIKLLNADMRLLLVNSQLKDGIIERLFLLLDCQIDCNGNKGLVVDPNKINNLKEKLMRYIANFSKLESLRFVEYWVPIKISSIQLEQYCATLLSNSSSLCSSSKNDAVGALRDILISTRKCCDHPYVMDPSLQASLIKEGKDILDVGIKASGKLQLLDAMLFEIRKRGLKVLILFQASGGCGNIGDILDDFVRERYGKDSYERIDGIVVSTKKQAAVNNFNSNKEMFVFLLETRACSSIIKLSSVDIVIIYGSDWCPMNDLRNLQKIRLDSWSEQIKVFRLYTSYTVEEKALILGKRDKALDCRLQNTNPSTCHMLLMWGASYLFDKLAKFHIGNAVTPNSEQSLLGDVIHEFLAAILEDSTDNSLGNSSLILRVKQNQEDDVANFPLFGERKMTLTYEEPPHVFWKNLLGGKQPEWSYVSVLSQRNRKRTQHNDNLSKKPEVEDGGIAKKHKKVLTNSISPPSLETGAGNTVGGNMRGTSAHPIPIDSSHAFTSSFLAENLLEVPEADTDKLEGLDLLNSQKSLHLLLKPEIAKLCEILCLTENVKATVESFLDYVMNNHPVSREPATMLEAFQISLCWVAASLLKYKLNHKESVALAKQHLNFGCRKAEADYFYSILRCLKNTFLDYTANLKMACFPKASQKLMKDGIQDHLHARTSKSVPCDLQNVGLETKALKPSQENDQVLSQLGLARNDFLKSIKAIEKKCQKQMTKLLSKQQGENENLCRKYEEDEAHLNNKFKTEAAVIRLCSNNSMRADKLKSLDTEYERKLEEFKHQKEMGLKDLEAKHTAERNKLQERETQWVEGVRSWAQVELINGKTSNGSEHSQVEAFSLSFFSKEHIMEGAQCTTDGGAPPEIPEALSSNGDEQDVLPFTSEQISNGANSSIPKSNLAGEKTPSGIPKMSSRNASDYVDSVIGPSSEGQTLDIERLQVPEAVCSNDGLENLNDKPSSEEQSFDGASFPMPREELTTEVPEMVSSSGGLENVVSMNHPSGEESSEGAASCMHDDDVVLILPKTALNRTLDDGTAIGFQQGRLACGISRDSLSTDDIAGVHQQSREAPSGVPETASGEAVECGETGMQQDGNFKAAKINQESHPSNKNVETNQQVGHVTLGVPEIDPGGAEEGAVTSNQLDENMQTDNSMANQGFQSWDRTSVDKQDGVPPLGEPETAPAELMEGCGIDREMDDIANQNNDVASDQPHCDVQIIDMQLQSLPSPELPSSLEVNLPLASGIEHQQICEGQPQLLENNTGLSTQSVYQSEMHSPVGGLSSQAGAHSSESFPIEIPLGGTGVHISDARSRSVTSGIINHPVQAGNPIRVPPPFSRDPLQNELERIQKETDQIISVHGFQKMQLKSDCEKEIAEVVAQIRRKYDGKIQEVETEYLSKKKDLEANQKKVLMNRILAEAFRCKCMDIRASNSRTNQQDLAPSFMQQLLQLSSQAPTQRPSAVFSNAGSLASLQTSAPTPPAANLHSSTPQCVNHSSARPCAGLSSAGHAASLQTMAPALPIVSPRGLAPLAVHRPSAQSLTAVLSSAGPGSSLQTTANSPPAANLHGSTPQVVHHSSALLLRNSMRPPHISSISPPTINLQVGSEIRAPAPHLQRFRSSISMSPASPSISNGMTCQQVAPYQLSTSATVTQLPAQLQSSTQQSILHDVVHCPESAAILLPHSSSSLSAVRLLIEVDNQAMRNPIPNCNLPPQTGKGPNVDSLVPPELGPKANPNEIVCLSDDDCSADLLY